MINLDTIKIKDLLRLDFNLRELDLIIADQVMKEVLYFKKRHAASINARLIFDTFTKELKDSEINDYFGDLRWTRGTNFRYFTEYLPYYSEKLEVALLLTEKFPSYKTESKELENELFEFSYIHKKTKDSITIRAKTQALAICLASLHLTAELGESKKPHAK